jgi:multifunctional methyltransferase subunit TRM112
MKILTHNMLQCHAKKCNGFPLTLTATKTSTTNIDFNPVFLDKLASKLDFNALQSTVASLGLSCNLDDKKELHSVLLEFEVEEGRMDCPTCHHEFPIVNGIPNMLLNENQV